MSARGVLLSAVNDPENATRGVLDFFNPIKPKRAAGFRRKTGSASCARATDGSELC